MPVRITSLTVKPSDPSSFQGFRLQVSWVGGAHSSSFLVRLQKVSIKALGPGDTARKPSRIFAPKPQGWTDTQTTSPRRWRFDVPKATAFYRVQVRGQNSFGPGVVGEQYLLVAKHNEGPIRFTPKT